jgi:uncharacterized membrane protein
MTRNLVALCALASDLAATALLWPRLPERVPVHWGISGEVDRYGSRWELVLLGPVLLAGLWLLLSLVRRIDPKASAPLEPDAPPAEAGALDAAVAIVLALFAVLHLVLLLQAAGLALVGPLLHALWISAFMVLLGNVLGRVRPNFFVGIRTPWTLSDDQVWRRAHRLGGRLLFASGLSAALLCAVLRPGPALGVAAGLLGASLLVPAAASFFWWRAGRRGA